MRRALRITLVGLAALVALALAALAGLRAWLESDAGERWLAGVVANQASQAIAGTVRVDRVDLTGLASAEAQGVALVAPDGEIAARAGAVEVAVRPAELLDERITLDRLHVRGLDLRLVGGDARGHALARALAPAAPDQGGPGRDLLVRDLRIGLERLAILPAPGAPPSFEAVDGLATGRLEREGGAIAIEAQADVALRAPVAGDASAEVAVRIAEGRLDVERLELTLPGGVRLEARTPPASSERAGAGGSAGAAGAGAETGPSLAVDLTLPPGGLVPYGGPQLQGSVAIGGGVALRGDRIAFDVSLEPPGGGELLADGAYDRASGGFEVLLDARGVDPSALVEGAPRGRVWAALQARGDAGEAPGVDARAWVAPSTLGGARIGPGRASLGLRDGRLTAERLRLRVPGGRLSGSFAVGGDRPPVAALDAEVARAGRLSSALRSAGLDVPEVRGSLSARVQASGRGADRALALDLRGERVAVRNLAARRLELHARLTPAEASLAASAETPRGPVEVRARAHRPRRDALRVEQLRIEAGVRAWSLARPAHVAWPAGRVVIDDLVLAGDGRLALDLRLARPWRPSAAVSADVALTGVPLALLAPVLPQPPPQGTLDLALTLAGTAARPRLSGGVDLALEAVRADGPSLAVHLDLDADPGELALEGTVGAEGRTLARVAGTLRASGAGPLWAGDLLASRVDATVEAGGLELEELAALGLAPASLAGRVRGSLEVTGPLRGVEAAGAVAVDGLVLEDAELGRLPPLAAELELGATRSSVDVEVRATLAGAPPVRARARAGAGLGALLGDGAAGVPLSAEVRVEPGPLALARPRVEAETLELAADAEGTLAAPVVRARLRADGLVLRGEPLGALAVDATHGDAATTVALDLAPAAGGRVEARAHLPDDGAWEVRLDADGARLTLPPLRDGLALERALLDGAITVRAGPVVPLAEGQLRAEASRLTIDELTLTDAAVDLAADGRTLVIDRAVASLGDGGAEARGRVTFDGRDGEAELTVRARELPLPVGPRPVGGLTTTVDASFALGAGALTGDVRLSPGEFRLPDGLPGELHPVELPSTIVVHEGGDAPSERAAAAAGEPLVRSAVVRISAPGDLWLRSDAANIEVVPDLVARWDGRRLAFTGEVVVPRGTVTVVKRRFEVERIALAFRGDPDVDPALDGRLAFERAAVDVWIGLSGTLREPELELTSDPPMDASEIATLVAVGGGGAAEGGLSGAVVSGALGFVAGQVGEALTAELPLDVFALELGPGGEARRLEAGAYVTPRLFVSFARNLLAEPEENANEVRAEYRLGRRVSVSTRYGDRQNGGVDLVYERRFASERQRRARASEPREPGPAEASTGSGDR